MRQIEEEDDTPATCPEDSNLTTLNVNCRGVIGRGDGISGLPGENGIPGVISNLDCNNHSMVMKRKNNSSTLLNTSTINTTGTIHTSAPPPVPPPATTNSTTNMRKTKRSPNERRFKCDQCDRMFFTRKDVKRHLVVHTGVRNYACPFCQQRFGRKDHLVRHAKKSHQKDTRASASSNIAVSPPSVGSTTNSPINHHHRRLTFSHSQVHHHGLPGAPNLNHHHPGRMMVNVNNNIHNNNTNGSGNNNANLSPCNYSSSNLTNIQLDPPSSIMLLGPSPNGSINGTNGNSNSNVSAPLTNCSLNGTNGINSVNGNSGINNNHHDICYPGNTNHHNGSMASSINDGHFGTTTTMGHHSSLCETPLFNNGGHYFSLGTGPTPFMNSAYITNCFGHITVNPGNTGAQVLTSVPTMCSTDQPNSVSCTNALSHLDVNHLHHFNQVFQ